MLIFLSIDVRCMDEIEIIVPYTFPTSNWILVVSSLLTSFGSKLFTSTYVSQSIKNFAPENFIYLMGMEFSQVSDVLPEKSKPPKYQPSFSKQLLI